MNSTNFKRWCKITPSHSCRAKWQRYHIRDRALRTVEPPLIVHVIHQYNSLYAYIAEVMKNKMSSKLLIFCATLYWVGVSWIRFKNVSRKPCAMSHNVFWSEKMTVWHVRVHWKMKFWIYKTLYWIAQEGLKFITREAFRVAELKYVVRRNLRVTWTPGWCRWRHLQGFFCRFVQELCVQICYRVVFGVIEYEYMIKNSTPNRSAENVLVLIFKL